MSSDDGVRWDGEEVGEEIPETCGASGCKERIDRSVHHTCGGLHYLDDGATGCGGWFCPQHLFCAEIPYLSLPASLCDVCLDLMGDLQEEWSEWTAKDEW